VCLQYLVERLFSHYSWAFLTKRVQARNSPIPEKHVPPVVMRSCNSNVRRSKLSSFGDVLCSSELQFATIKCPPRAGHARVVSNGNEGFKAIPVATNPFPVGYNSLDRSRGWYMDTLLLKSCSQSDNSLIQIVLQLTANTNCLITL
jgi:hypothetical protein